MLIFFAALLSSAAAADICCSPDQWQGDVGILMASFTNGKTSLIEGMMKVSYDAVNQIVAYDQTLNVDGFDVQQRIVSDYKNRAMYTIRNGECNRTKTDDWVPSCVPGDALETTSNSRYGLGDNSVQIKAYSFNVRGYSTNVAVTADLCVPVTTVVTGTLDPVFAGGKITTETMQALTYANINGGIANRNVFFVPAQCESGNLAAVGRRSLFNH